MPPTRLSTSRTIGIERVQGCTVATQIRAAIANPPNSPQLGGIPYHFPKLYPGPFNSVGIRPRTDTQTHMQTRVA